MKTEEPNACKNKEVKVKTVKMKRETLYREIGGTVKRRFMSDLPVVTSEPSTHVPLDTWLHLTLLGKNPYPPSNGLGPMNTPWPNNNIIQPEQTVIITL